MINSRTLMAGLLGAGALLALPGGALADLRTYTYQGNPYDQFGEQSPTLPANPLIGGAVTVTMTVDCSAAEAFAGIVGGPGDCTNLPRRPYEEYGPDGGTPNGIVTGVTIADGTLTIVNPDTLLALFETDANGDISGRWWVLGDRRTGGFDCSGFGLASTDSRCIIQTRNDSGILLDRSELHTDFLGGGEAYFGSIEDAPGIWSQVVDQAVLTCSGTPFLAPFDEPLALNSRARRAIRVAMQLLDDPAGSLTGVPNGVVTDLDIAAPVINVAFSSTGADAGDPVDPDDLDSVGAADDGIEFRFDPVTGEWSFVLATADLSVPGFYTVSATAGDEDHAIHASCHQYFERRD